METSFSENNIITLATGRRIGYAEYGDRKGKPLFFFHGYPSCRIQGKMLHKKAKELHIRLISLDRPGYGLSDFQKNRTLLDWPGDIQEIADQLYIKKFSVLGISGGGPYAAVCAYKLPKRVLNTGIVVGLAPLSNKELLQQMAFLHRLAWNIYRKSPLLHHMGTLFYLALDKKIIPNYYSLLQSVDKKVVTKSIIKVIEKNRHEAFRQGSKGASMDIKIYTSGWGFELKDIKNPVLLWYGADDKLVSPLMGKYYASQIPNSKLTIYKEAGHFLYLQHSDTILKTFIQ